MRVRMLETRRASPDSAHPQIFEAGKAYDVPDELAQMWLASHRAEEDKMIDAPPETKARKGRRGKPSALATETK